MLDTGLAVREVGGAHVLPKVIVYFVCVAAEIMYLCAVFSLQSKLALDLFFPFPAGATPPVLEISHPRIS